MAPGCQGDTLSVGDDALLEVSFKNWADRSFLYLMVLKFVWSPEYVGGVSAAALEKEVPSEMVPTKTLRCLRRYPRS